MADKKEIALTVEHVGKYFKLPTEDSSEIKQLFINWTRGIKGYKKQEVLKDINFTVNKGDFFGIVGRNGSGKSTLLKVISGIYTPNKGKVHINGTLIPFIELGVGFNPELTGRENIYLNGALLGFTKKQIDDMYQDIVDFAELHDFMDQKLKNYSSGMQVRLAFSVAIKARGDILVLDEVLAVGDEAFQKKCNDYFYDAKREGKTIILVTHSMDAVRQFCNKAIFINEGRIEAAGNPNVVANKYSDLFRKEYIKKIKEDDNDNDDKDSDKYCDVELELIHVEQIKSGQWMKTKLVEFHKDYRINLKFRLKQDYLRAKMGVQIVDRAGRTVHSFTSNALGLHKFSLRKGLNRVAIESENVLGEGDYTVRIMLYDESNGRELFVDNEALHFIVIDQDVVKVSKFGLTHPQYKFMVNDENGVNGND